MTAAKGWIDITLGGLLEEMLQFIRSECHMYVFLLA